MFYVQTLQSKNKNILKTIFYMCIHEMDNPLCFSFEKVGNKKEKKKQNMLSTLRRPIVKISFALLKHSVIFI